MGRYTYSCPKCGRQQQTKTTLDHSAEVPHRLCASCEEEAKKARESEPEAPEHQAPRRR